MAERDSVSPDQKEFIFPFSQEWLGGMFEIGGSMHYVISYSTQKGIQYPNAYPAMQIGEKDLDKLKRFQAMVGGNFKKGGSHASPTYWYLQGAKAVPLAEWMSSFAPSRQDIILSFLLWEDAESIDERIEIAKASREERKPLTLTRDDYMPLVRKPDFLAGVIDMRGSFHTNEAFNDTTDDAYGWVFPRLSVSSTNRPLLEALHHTYGGSIEEVILKGSQQKIGRLEFTAANDSLKWKTGHEVHNQVMQIVTPRLKLLAGK